MKQSIKKDYMMAALAIHGGKPVRDNFLVFGAPDIGDEEISEVIDCLKSGWISTGPRVKKFEDQLKKYVGASYSVATNSCTAAMHLCLLLSGIGPGDEVITSPMTFGATVNVIEHVGATPVFVDIEPKGFCMNPEQIESKITSKTRAIIPVHFAGYPCDMDSINHIANAHHLIVIEDAAHALGTKYKHKYIGNTDHYACFSFYVSKNVSAGEGGMMTTNQPDICDKMRIYSLHGMDRHAWKRYSKTDVFHYDIVYPGYKYNMTDLNASIAIHQLNKIEAMLQIRKQHIDMYNHLFIHEDSLILPPVFDESAGSRCSWHLYPVMIKPGKLRVSRDEIMRALIHENIGVAVHFRSIIEHDFYKNKYSIPIELYPNAHFVSNNVFSLPLTSKISENDVRDVATALLKVITYYKR